MRDQEYKESDFNRDQRDIEEVLARREKDDREEEINYVPLVEQTV